MKKISGYIFLFLGIILMILYPIAIIRVVSIITVAFERNYHNDYSMIGYSIGYVGISVLLCIINGIIIYLLYKYGVRWIRDKK